MLYLDTSLLVAALTPETRTIELQQWLGRQKPDELVISDWVVAEFSAALAAKLRAGRVSVSERAAALAAIGTPLKQLDAAPSRSRGRQPSISAPNCASPIARPGAIGLMRRVCSSKSQMNSQPVPTRVKLRPSLVKTVMRGPKRVRRTVG